MEEQNNFKKGLNIYLYYLTIPAFVFFVLLNYFSRNIKIDALDVGLMISVVSFLFGFLITITFSMLLTKVSSLKDSLAVETGRLTSLFLLSKNLGQKFHGQIVELIDTYTQGTLREYRNYSISREPVYSMYKATQLMEIETKHQEAQANSFFYILGELEPTREKIEYLTGRHVEWSLKFSNYLLGIILVVLLFLNRGDTFTNALFIILSTIIVFIFLIIEDYDDLRIGDYSANISNAEQLFDLMELPRYYPQDVLNRVRLETGKRYRIGIRNDDGSERVLELTYSPLVGMKLKHLIERIRRRKTGKN